ncbi:MAG: 50S ribosomal protein L6 [Myxococcota bacterium]|jgi:large subunit ribosomal protein L6|nr:50S ribosomal protein L6 [Myxococcota bacterium]
MSRIGNAIITVPSGVEVKINGATISVKGPKGELSGTFPEIITSDLTDGVLKFSRPDESRETRALHGLVRALVNNMVVGVTDGFSKELEIQGVGYRADMKGKKLNLALGFSHPVEIDVPEGLKVSVDGTTNVKIEGIDKQLVGQFAADIRSIRPPEPYKGKGIRYAGEHVRRKVGKAGATA